MGDGMKVCKCQCQCKLDKVQQDDNSNSEVAVVWWDFLHETTFHGCRNIEDRRRTIAYRILWTLIVLGMLGCLLYTLFQSFLGYYEYRVISKSKLQIYREMPFPSVTVCSAAAINVARKNMSQTLKNYFASGTLLGFLVDDLSWTEELEQTTLRDIYDNFTVLDPKKFITYDSWHGEGNISFQPVRTWVGTCFVANSTDISGQKAMATVEGRHGGLELMLNVQEEGAIMQGDMTYGAMVYIHDPREDARTDSGVMVEPGHSFNINLKPTKYNFLPWPYKSYGELYCVKTSDSYSYEACKRDWSNTQTATKCNCTSGLEPPAITERLPLCSLKQHSKCYTSAHRYFTQQTLNDNFTVCPKPCAFTRYETSVSFSKFPTTEASKLMVKLAHQTGSPHVDVDYIKKNVLKVTIYFDRFFMENIMYEPESTINGILSSLGGQMGFFLGASLVTVAEFGEALLRSFGTLLKKTAGAGNKPRVISHGDT